MPSNQNDVQVPASLEKMDLQQAGRMKSGSYNNTEMLVNLLKRAEQGARQTIVPDTPKPSYIVGVDFDGTVVTHSYPEIGTELPYCQTILRQLVKQGAGIILFTMRSGETLEQAVEWFAKREIPLYGINQNPHQHTWTSSPKPYCHLYVDDAGLGCPLNYDEKISKRPFVDWIGVDRLLQKHDWYTEPIVK